MREGIAKNRLERLEKEEGEEQEQEDDKDFTKCVVRRWMMEKGFGFVETESRENAFLHVSAVSSGEVPKIGSVVFARLRVDESRTDAGLRAVEAYGHEFGARGGQGCGRRRRPSRPQRLPGWPRYSRRERSRA